MCVLRIEGGFLKPVETPFPTPLGGDTGTKKRDADWISVKKSQLETRFNYLDYR